jgi:hypothetical protein
VLTYGWWHAMLLAAYLRWEGCLAAASHRAAGANQAHQRDLRLRDPPDPVPLQEQVAQVRAHRGVFVGEPGR